MSMFATSLLQGYNFYCQVYNSYSITSSNAFSCIQEGQACVLQLDSQLQPAHPSSLGIPGRDPRRLR